MIKIINFSTTELIKTIILIIVVARYPNNGLASYVSKSQGSKTSKAYT